MKCAFPSPFLRTSHGRLNHSRRTLLLSLLLGSLCALGVGPIAAARGQGVLFIPGSAALGSVPNLVLRDPKTGDCFAPDSGEWEIEVRGGPKGTPKENWDKLQAPSAFRRRERPLNPGLARYMPAPRMPRLLTVPGAAAGDEAEIEFIVTHREHPDLPVSFGPFTVALCSMERPEVPQILRQGGFTNDIPEGLEVVLPRRPSIPGEPVFEDKPLSYWLSGFAMFPGRVPVGQPSRDEAHRAVRSLGLEAVPYILQYPDTNIPIRSIARDATSVLAFSGMSNELDRLLIDALASTNDNVVLNAVSALPCYTVKAEAGLLLNLATNAAEGVRQEALGRLSGCGANDEKLLPIWLSRLDSEDANRCIQALQGLQALGPKAAAAVPEIEKILEHGQGRMRPFAARALWGIERRTNIVSVLIKEIDQANRWIELMDIIHCLESFDEAAKPAVPSVVDKLKAWAAQGEMLPPPVLRSAAEWLKKIDPGSVEKLPADPVQMRRMNPQMFRPERPAVPMDPRVIPGPGLRPVQPPPTTMPWG